MTEVEGFMEIVSSLSVLWLPCLIAAGMVALWRYLDAHERKKL